MLQAKRTMVVRQNWDSHDVLFRHAVSEDYEEEKLLGRIMVANGRFVIHRPGVVGFARPVDFFTLEEAVSALMRE